MRRRPLPHHRTAGQGRHLPLPHVSEGIRLLGAALVAVPDGNLTWSRGEPGEFRSSAVVARGFCADCGTPLYMKEDDYGVWEIAIGSLDNPAPAAPTTQVGIESELPWFTTLHALPRRRTDEDRLPEDLKKLKSFQHPDHDTDTWP